jgi:hypothetical protein
MVEKLFPDSHAFSKRYVLQVLNKFSSNSAESSKRTHRCADAPFWPPGTPMSERLEILRKKAIYCPYCGEKL